MSKISQHFTLDELIESDTARRLQIDNTPTENEVANLILLAEEILEPLRQRVRRPVFVSSGFRCAKLNRAIGGSKKSEHIEGRAADVKVDGMAPLEVCSLIDRMGLPYNQLIHEFGAWTHCSVAPIGSVPKRQILTIDRFGTRPGLHPARKKGA